MGILYRYDEILNSNLGNYTQLSDIINDKFITTDYNVTLVTLLCKK